MEELFSGVKDKKERNARGYRAVMYRLKEVGEHLGLHCSTISRIVTAQKSKVKI
ncbi:hypothetical protein H5T52_01700 [Candidatus Bipolaricaulota bacterium]|nr:hypothetical protein [Candidatus Bipolaricaulota bacterium]